MMKFNLVRPCAECPFRNDLPAGLQGWLKGRCDELAETVLENAHTFNCHKTLDKDEYEQSHCAGALIMQQKLGTTWKNLGLRYACATGDFKPGELDMQSPIFDTKDEFLNFHRAKRSNE